MVRAFLGGHLHEKPLFCFFIVPIFLTLFSEYSVGFPIPLLYLIKVLCHPGMTEGQFWLVGKKLNAMFAVLTDFILPEYSLGMEIEEDSVYILVSNRLYIQIDPTILRHS